jgi:subtilase family serine protease
LKRAAEGSQLARVEPPPPEVREEARRELENLGFTIVRVSPLSILIEAPAETFESVFHTQAQRRNATSHKPWPRSYLAWKEEPQIPAPLEKTVQHIVLPEPVQLH